MERAEDFDIGKQKHRNPEPGQNYQQLGSNNYECSDDPNVGMKHKLQP